jgi:hypothetical protein
MMFDASIYKNFSSFHKMNLFKYVIGSLEVCKAYFEIKRVRDIDPSDLTDYDRFGYYHSRLFIKEFNIRFGRDSTKKKRLCHQWDKCLDKGDILAYLCYDSLNN